VLLPSFVTPEEQRELVRWSLRDQARHPNDTNLDIHYTLPQGGIWHAYLSARQNAGAEILIQPRVTPEGAVDSSGPRKLIDNTPASPNNFYSLSTSSRNPATPSPSTQPSPPCGLLPKLRWANIGWTYHWGSKQYDFARGKGEVHPRLRELCKSIVRSVDWGQVFNSEDGADPWGDGPQDWMTWGDTYGTWSFIRIVNTVLTIYS
jgi:alkylated DNA repair protein alkB family protein 1